MNQSTTTSTTHVSISSDDEWDGVSYVVYAGGRVRRQSKKTGGETMCWGIFFGQSGYIPETWSIVRTKTEAIQNIRQFARELRESGWAVSGNGRNLWYEAYPDKEAKLSPTFLPFQLYADVVEESELAEW